MAKFTCYLKFRGNCEEAFTFYRSVFGGEYAYLGRFRERPLVPGAPAFSEEEKNKIMHITLDVGTSTLQGSDYLDNWGPPFVEGNNFSVSVKARNTKLADAYFKGLSAGGRVTMPMEHTFWGTYFGMLVDPYGVNWMVSADAP